MKYRERGMLIDVSQSRPARGGWIEISHVNGVSPLILFVPSRKGRVD